MEIDSRLTFDSFVVGPANRLASAAAACAAESPGTSYNPLFLYAASGLGKSHILAAIATQGRESHPNLAVKHQTAGTYLGELEAAIQLGIQDAFNGRYTDVGIFLLDDVQALGGQGQAQDMLLRVIDDLAGKGAQVVLASDRPPTKISGLDRRLLSRFSGGLIVDIGAPDYDTRVAIVRKKMEERKGKLAQGVAETLGHLSFSSVRQLERAVEQLVEKQASRGQTLTVEDLPAVFGEAVKAAAAKVAGPATRKGRRGRAKSGEPAAPTKSRRRPAPPETSKPPPPPKPEEDTRPARTTGVEAAPPERTERPSPAGTAKIAVIPDPDDPNWRDRIQAVVDSASADSISPTRILYLLEASDPPEGWHAALQHFEKQLSRVREVRRELERLGNPWPETAAVLLTDPDRLEEAESLLASAHERVRPFPALPEGPRLRGRANTHREDCIGQARLA